MISITADRPWEKIGMDLFYQEGSWFVLATDYYSSFFEIEQLRDITTESIISFMKKLIARYGIPEKVITDNGR